MKKREGFYDGVLCFQDTLDGVWAPYTAEALSIAFVAVRKAHKNERYRANRLQKQLNAIRELAMEVAG